MGKFVHQILPQKIDGVEDEEPAVFLQALRKVAEVQGRT
jgi:hypothetical protein